MSPPDEDPTAPLLDGRYRLGERLGRGGMADVYRADDVLLGREVALKLLRPGVDGIASPERARGEASALAALSHPSLVTLLDARLENAEREYLVMELIEGPTLAERIREGALPPDDVARIAGEIAEALHVVHGAGIVHRDVKPSNVLLGPGHLPGQRFHAKLADFGIAYLVDSTRVTSPGMLIGTAAYLAPEQVNGADPAPPADVYALGLVLLEALTGSPAFPHAGGVASAIARLSAPPEIPVEVGPRWTQLIERMTRIDPAARPTALEVAVEAAGWSTAGRPALPATSAAAAAAAPIAAAAAAAAGAPGAAALDPGTTADAPSATAAGAPTSAPSAAAASAPTELLDGADPATADPATKEFATPAAAGATRRRSAAATRTRNAAKPRRPRRRALLIGAAAIAAVAVIGAGVWAASPALFPTPASTEPAITEPEIVPSAPAPSAPATAATPAVVGESETDVDAEKEAERAAKEAERAQQQAEDDARRQAEEAQRQAEEQARQQEQQEEESDDDDDDEGSGEQSPAPPSPSPTPAQPSPPADDD